MHAGLPRTVSVVIATYNQERFLPEAIESVLSQSVPVAQLIVVDDGSTDNTTAAVQPFMRHIEYVRTGNRERGAARNSGLERATGAFIAFLDSDDVWKANKIECDLERLRESPSSALVYANYEIMDASGTTLRVRRASGYEGRVTRELLENNFIAVGAHLAYTDAVRACGGFREERSLSGSEDWELWVRLSTRIEVAHVPEATTRVRTYPTNTMSNAASMSRSMSNAIDIMENSDYLSPSDKEFLPRVRALKDLVDAINYATAGQRANSWRSLAAAAKRSPAVLLDARFGYTCLRNCLPKRLQSPHRAIANLFR